MTRFHGWSRAGEPSSTRKHDRLPLEYPVLDESELRAVVDRLRLAREGLLERDAGDVAEVLDRVGGRFLADDDPLRKRALEWLVRFGQSEAGARGVLDGMAADWAGGNRELLGREFATTACLDRFVPEGDRLVRALGFPLSLHVTAGTVPGVSVSSLLRGLLTKSAVLLKPGAGDVVLPVLFRDALAEADSALAEAVAVLYWPGDDEVGRIAVDQADLVVVYGSDAVVEEVRRTARATTRIVAYHHRASFGLVGESAEGPELERAVGHAAEAVAAFDQRGCVSPLALLVLGDAARADVVAEMLAGELRGLEQSRPPARLSGAEWSSIHQQRAVLELGAGPEPWYDGSGSWTVARTSGLSVEPAAGRFVRVCPVASEGELIELLAPLGAHLQCVAAVGLGERRSPVHEALARAGVIRITDFGSLAFPPPWWHHDGTGPLRALVRWVEVDPKDA